MEHRSLRWLVGCVGLWLGCAGGGPGQKPTVKVPWGEPGAAVAAGKARWAYTPGAPRGLLGRLAVSDRQELYFGRRGERWLVEGDGEGAVAAGDLAEQDLIGAARGASGGWLFVGEQGAIFEADEPLGPFRRALSAPEPVARVEASPQGLLAVTLRGSLLRSGDGGSTFQRAPLDAPFVGDVQLLENGRGLLLAFPEKLFETSDGGLQWKPLDARPVGAFRLRRMGAEGILVQGVSSSLLWKEGSLRASRAQPEASVFQLPVALGGAPDAALMAMGMGFWRGDQVIEVAPPEKRNGPWMLGSGALGQRQTRAPLEGTEGCQRLVVDGNEQAMVAACSMAQRGASLSAVKLLRYAAGGGPPEELAGTLEGPLGEVRLSLGRDGRVLLWGACRAGSGRASCDGETALLLPKWQGSPAEAEGKDTPSPWQSVAVPGQSGRPVAAAFGASGGRAYMVAQRGKTRDLGLFLSHDGGRTFEGRELGLAGALDESERRLISGLRTASLSTLDDGLVTVAFEGQFGAVVAVTDEDGRVLSVSTPPAGSALTRVGLAGRRALVVEGAAAFESLDGGVSWASLGDVPALRCPDRGTCERRVACGLAGCVVGDAASRVGWGGQGEGLRRPAEPAQAPLGFGRASPTPVVCRLQKEKWQPLARGAELPTVHKADRGKTAWAASAFTPASGQVVAVHGLHTPAGKIEEVTVLPAAREPLKTAVQVSTTQVEGVAALRVELAPPRASDPGPVVQRVEVAWENLFEGKLSRGTLPPPGHRSSLSFDPSLGQVSLLQVPLLSISNGGIFVRFDAAAGSDLFFLDHRGKVDRTTFPAVPAQDVNGDDLSMAFEAVRVDGKSVPVGYRDALLIRPRGASDFEATSVFPPAGTAFQPHSEMTFSYLNGTPYLVHVGQVPAVGASLVSLFPFQATGPLLGPRSSGPSQRALVERYRPCAAADRGKTPRVVAPAEKGTRRGVLIEGPDGSSFASMVSGGMVLYGNAEAPCGSVIEGLPASDDGQARERALVFLGDLEHGWFFRTGVNDVVEARQMTCKLSPGAALPPEVQSAIDRVPTGGTSITVRPRRPTRRP